MPAFSLRPPISNPPSLTRSSTYNPLHSLPATPSLPTPRDVLFFKLTHEKYTIYVSPSSYIQPAHLPPPALATAPEHDHPLQPQNPLQTLHSPSTQSPTHSNLDTSRKHELGKF